jgi:hypothetical protein
MLGLAFIFVFLIYLLISIGVIAYTVRKAKQRGIAGWKWGVPAGLIMYLLVFWDHIPTLVVRNYYCNKEAGFKIYKTLEQWKKENPGVAERLSYKEISDSKKEGDDYIYHLNERFDWRIESESVLLSLHRTENKIVDVSNGEILAQYIDFRTGWGNIAIGANTWREFKFWLVSESCERDGKSRGQFYIFEDAVQKLGRKYQ